MADSPDGSGDEPVDQVASSEVGTAADVVSLRRIADEAETRQSILEAEQKDLQQGVQLDGHARAPSAIAIPTPYQLRKYQRTTRPPAADNGT